MHDSLVGQSEFEE